MRHLFEVIAAGCRQLAPSATVEAARVGLGLPDALTAPSAWPTGVQLAPALSPYDPTPAG
ncbi:hypothetical protein IM697_22070 [Streptomyces ferrugineus]|uniref:Uncharacterized protein n=1 Tax=Streptomyces ferrugineus TaxID=1413221 RepID=A0A7M2SZ33_9ACTN|nr:hypothetical protein [Streptomyces ferrugineus]QOV40833.1 hypothetical protein IM697_22070 [Streptomyces ferrugineus]